MGAYMVGIGTVTVLVLVSLSAGRQLRHLAELPMQWGLDGKPTWSAPRYVALAFTPAVGSLIMLAIALKGSISLGAVCVVAASFIAAHILHLTLIARRSRLKAAFQPEWP